MMDRCLFPRVSVVIPTHNRAHLLSRAIQSVLNQTYENFEIIVVDDASSDETSEMIKHFGDHRIKYIRHTCNEGSAASRNTGIKNSQGNYIGFLDDDDEWLPNKLERQILQLERNEQVGLIYSGFLVRDLRSGKTIGTVLPEKRGYIFHDLLHANCVGAGGSSVLVRKECLNRENLFDERMRGFEDWDMWLRLSRHCLFDYVKEPLVIIHIHKNRKTTRSESGLRGKQMILEKYKEDIMSDRTISSKHYLRLGSSYCQLGDMKRGREEIRRSIKLRPTNVSGFITYLASFSGSAMYNIIINRYKALQYSIKRFPPFT